MKSFIITENGSTHINKDHKDSRSALYISGTLGVAATATLTYKNIAGDHLPFVDGVLAVGDQIPVDHGNGVEVYITVANADVSTSIEVVCAGID